MDYTTLSLAQVRAGLDAVDTDTRATFGALDRGQLNWRPDGTRWSVAQCLEHLSAASHVAPDVLDRFLTQNREIASWLRGLDESRAARAIMVSPFVNFITYGVLDGARVILTHDHRHIEQARRVTQAPGFPR
jgi:hypothetical protein